MKFVTSEERLRPVAEVGGGEVVVVGVGVALTNIVWKVAHGNSSLFALEGAILGKMENIYLLVDDDDMV